MYTGIITIDFLNNSLWMSWNIFLALIPFLLASHLFHPKQKIGWLWSLGFIVFVIFLPNAPYILTDSIHLYTASKEISSHKALFVMTGQFLVLLFFGYFLFVESYRKFERFVLRKKLYNQRYLVRLISFTTTSIGVYLGRFLRLNSWDVFVNPKWFISSLIHISKFHAVFFVSFFTIFLFSLYFVYEKVDGV